MVYKRKWKQADGTVVASEHYWYRFQRDGKDYHINTWQSDKRTANELEADHKTRLARGEAGFVDARQIPTLAGFQPEFEKAIEKRSAEKPRTIEFYKSRYARLLKFPALANARLDRIDERMVELFIQDHDEDVAVATVNRALATLRRALRLAEEWRIISRAPRIRLLSGERVCDYVLHRALEPVYLAACREPLHDAALLMLNTGLRVGEALNLSWEDVYLEPVGAASLGHVSIRKGKTKNAIRSVPLTDAATDMLAARKKTSASQWVFPGDYTRVGEPDKDGPFLNSSLAHQHVEVREMVKLPEDFTLHCLRHTALTRIGETGASAFAIMKIAGHSSITVSQRYVHPTNGMVESAILALQGKPVSFPPHGGKSKSQKVNLNSSVSLRWARSSTGRATDS